MDSLNDEQRTGYMERTRLYYRALGYETDYVWSTFDDVPFSKLAKPLSQSRIALLTTAGPLDRSNIDEAGRKRVWSAPIDPAPTALTTDVAWDRESTHTDDVESFLPIKSASDLAAAGTIAGLSDHFVGLPTEYSQRKTIELDAPDVLAKVRAGGADAVVLCPL